MLLPAVLALLPLAYAEDAPAAPAPLPAASKAAPPTDDSFARDPEGVGLGIILGLPTGVSAAWRPGGRFFVAGAVAWSLPQWAQVHADAAIELADPRTAEMPDMHFPVYVGAGARLRLGAGTGYEALNLALRVPVGMSFWHEDLPIEGFLELVPGVGVFPTTEFIFDAAIGARFYIDIGGGPRFASPEPE